MATTTKRRDSAGGSDAGDKGSADSLASQLGLDRLGEQLQGLAAALADRGVSVVTDRLDGLTNKTSGATGKTVKNMAKGDSAPKAMLKAGIETVKDSGAKGVSSVMDKVSDAVGGDNGKDKQQKFTNIVEQLDLPVPRAVAYKAWTQFEEFPSFMRKVENVEQQEDQTIEWKAQIFWSHRSWTAEIVDQVPDQRIVWRSKGEKGHVDGAVTFHELTPDLTRMMVNLEYYPQGLVERTGNLWRAAGRRVRLELKLFRRYLTSEVLMRQGEVEGWPGEIHDGEVTAKSADSKDQDSKDQDSKDQDSKDQDSERRSASAPAAKSSAKPAPAAPTSSRSRSAAKKSSSSESAPSRPRPAAKKSSSNESAPSRRPAAKKSSSSASSSRKTTAKKSATSSRSRS
jgi:uncharacterized membrane protein